MRPSSDRVGAHRKRYQSPSVSEYAHRKDHVRSQTEVVFCELEIGLSLESEPCQILTLDFSCLQICGKEISVV
jgi:hypothetical protein